MNPRPALLLLASLLVGASAPMAPEPVGLVDLLSSLFPCIEALDATAPELLDETDLAIIHGLWDPPP
jgi:hypothetical protein